MTNTDERRWRQRLESFGAALARLDEACEQESYTNLERAGLARTFMLSYELGWKVLKDLLFFEGHDLSSPREAIRTSFESGYIGENDCETFLDAIGNRNLLNHTYKDSLAREAEALIKDRYHPMLRRLWHTLKRKESVCTKTERIRVTDGLKPKHRATIINALSANDRVERAVLFGSRATRTYTTASDVDIALFRELLTLTDQARLGAVIEELAVPQRADLLLHATIDSDVLREHIERQGIEWYCRQPSEKTELRGAPASTPGGA